MGIRFGFQEGRGRLNYSVFLGYQKGTKGYEIVPGEAEVVRRIYRLYLEGFSPNIICQELMEENITTPAGGNTWYPSTVQSILENEKYCGDLLMQKYYVEDFLTHKSVRNTGALPQYFVEDDHAPIVPKAVYYQVQCERKRRSALMLDPGKLRFGRRIALNGRLICGKCGRILKRYVKPNEALTDWRCRQRAMVKKSNTKENASNRCDLRIVKETEIQKVVLTAFNRLPEMKPALIASQDHLRNAEIEKIDALLSALSTQQDQMESRMDQLTATIEKVAYAADGPEAETESETDESLKEVDSLKEQIISIQDQKNALCAQRAEHARHEIQLRILLELIDQMTGMSNEAENGDGACYDYEDFFRRTQYHVPSGVLQDGHMVLFENDLVIRYLDSVIVEDHGYVIRFKAGVEITVDEN